MARRASSFSQSSSGMLVGFTFGAITCDFFIPSVAFFGGMVVGGGWWRVGREVARRRRAGRGETRRRRGGCSGHELAGSGGKWRGWWGIGGIWEKNSGKVCFASKGVLAVGAELSRCAGAPDRILPHRGWHGSADSFIGLAPAPARVLGRRCGPVFAPSPISTPAAFWKQVGSAGKDALNLRRYASG
jgi:hypothetical protein